MPGVQSHRLWKPLSSRATFAESPRTAPGIYLGALWRASGRKDNIPLHLQERLRGPESLCLAHLPLQGSPRGDSEQGAHFLLLWTLGPGRLERSLRTFVTTVSFQAAFAFFPSWVLSWDSWSSLLGLLALLENVAVICVLWNVLESHGLAVLSWVGRWVADSGQRAVSGGAWHCSQARALPCPGETLQRSLSSGYRDSQCQKQRCFLSCLAVPKRFPWEKSPAMDLEGKWELNLCGLQPLWYGAYLLLGISYPVLTDTGFHWGSRTWWFALGCWECWKYGWFFFFLERILNKDTGVCPLLAVRKLRLRVLRWLP